MDQGSAVVTPSLQVPKVATPSLADQLRELQEHFHKYRAESWEELQRLRDRIGQLEQRVG